MAWRDVVRLDMVRQGVVGCRAARLGAVWHGKVRRESARSGRVGLGMIERVKAWFSLFII